MKCDICDNDATVFVTQIIGDKTTHVNSCDACAKRPDFSFLPFRLKRETPFKSQLGCTFTLTTFLLGMAVFCYFVAKSPSTGESWVRYVAVAAFGLCGLLLLWSFIRQLAALGVKETSVDLS